jgi:hypothetical protein
MVQNMPTTASYLFFAELDSLTPGQGGIFDDRAGVIYGSILTLFANLDGAWLVPSSSALQTGRACWILVCLDRNTWTG